MRLFFGIELADCARQAAAEALRRACLLVSGRFVLPENLHMTLCYVGEADQERVQAVGKCVRIPRARLALGEAGWFGRPGKAILYLKVEGAEIYAEAACALREALGARGLPFDPKPFVPHITLARRADLANVDLAALGVEPAQFIPVGLTLFHSARADGTLRYVPVARWSAENGSTADEALLSEAGGNDPWNRFM